VIALFSVEDASGSELKEPPVMWDLWRTKWHGAGLTPKYTGSPVSFHQRFIYSFIHSFIHSSATDAVSYELTASLRSI